MSTSLALSAAANVQSAAALAAAEQAAKDACRAFAATFNNQGASVPDLQYYAACIQRLYPVESDFLFGTSLVLMRAFVAALLLAVPIGAWLGYRESGDKIGIFFGGILVPAAVFFAVVFVGVGWWGVKFVWGIA